MTLRAIYIADLAAEGNWAGLHRAGIKYERQTVSLTNILEEIIPHHTWHLRYIDSDRPCLQELKSLSATPLLESYLQERDNFRALRGKPAYWSGTSAALAAKCHNQPDTWWEAARLTKSTYDKYMHGRNRAKCAKNDGEEQELKRCSICGGNDSQAHQMVDVWFLLSTCLFY